MKIFEYFGEALFKEFILGWEPVSIVHYTRSGSSIKQPTLPLPVMYPKSSYKIMDPGSAALPKNLRSNSAYYLLTPPWANINAFKLNYDHT